MDDILGGLSQQLKELERYKAKYGPLDDETPLPTPRPGRFIEE